MVMMNYLKEKMANLLHLDWAALNLAKSTVGIAIVLVALILFSTIGAFGFTVAFGAALVDFQERRPSGLDVLARGALPAQQPALHGHPGCVFLGGHLPAHL